MRRMSFAELAEPGETTNTFVAHVNDNMAEPNEEGGIRGPARPYNGIY